MGINSAAFASWKASAVGAKLLFNLNIGNQVDVDGNALAFVLYPKAGSDVNRLASVMVSFLSNLSSLGFIVTVIFDNFTHRPQTKRASLQRKKETELLHIHSIYTKLQLLKHSSAHGDPVKLSNYQKLVNSISMSLSRRVKLPNDFNLKIQEKIILTKANEMNSYGGYVNSKVLVAKFEADYVIARRFVRKECSFIYGVDSDYYALIGPTTLLILDMSIKKNKSTSLSSDNYI